MDEVDPRSSSVRKNIGIAVVVKDGCCLVGVRAAEVALPGKAEFPGGKCESGESAAACCVRECLEETGLKVDIDQLLCERDFDYAHAKVRLAFYLCRLVDATAEIPTGWKWIPIAQLRELDFPEANAEVIQLLMDRNQ